MTTILSQLKQLPWNNLLMYFWGFRRAFATIDVPDAHPRITVDISEGEAREIFRRDHCIVAWPFSYRYEGEVLNMVRPEYRDDEYEYYQLHIRGFLKDGKLVLMAHYELDPTDYPRDHIKEVNMDVEEGTALLKELLDDEGVQYEVRDDIAL